VREVVPQNVRPPQQRPNPVLNRRVRYGCTTTGAYNITPKGCAFTLGAMCTSGTVAYTLCTAFRVRRIQVWGIAAQAGNTSVVSITWFGDQTLNWESNRETLDSSTSTAYVPYVDVRPPKTSSAAMWQAAQSSAFSTAVLFQVSLSAGGVIDVEYEYVLADGNASPTATQAISGGVAGTVKYGPLDGYGGGFIPTEGVTAM